MKSRNVRTRLYEHRPGDLALATVTETVSLDGLHIVELYARGPDSDLALLPIEAERLAAALRAMAAIARRRAKGQRR